MIVAETSDVSSPSNAEAISGSPRIVSAMLKRMFCEAHPIELNASAIATARSLDAVAASKVASSAAWFAADTVTSPPAVTLLSEIDAVDEVCTTLVTIWPLIAFCVPEP